MKILYLYVIFHCISWVLRLKSKLIWGQQDFMVIIMTYVVELVHAFEDDELSYNNLTHNMIYFSLVPCLRKPKSPLLWQSFPINESNYLVRSLSFISILLPLSLLALFFALDMLVIIRTTSNKIILFLLKHPTHAF